MRDILINKGYNVNYFEYNGGPDFLCRGENLERALISLMHIDKKLD